MASIKNTIVQKEKEEKTEKRIPYHRKPDDMTIDEWQMALRKQYALEQDFTITNLGEHPVFSDFNVYNPKSEKTYKVAIRSKEPGLNFCSCPDFKVNMLGTCKHIEYLLYKLNEKKKNRLLFERGIKYYYSSVSLRYGKDRKIWLRTGENNYEKINEIAKEYFDENNFLKDNAFEIFEQFLQKAIAYDDGFKCYPDAVDYIIEVRSRKQRAKLFECKYPDGDTSSDLDKLTKTTFYKYQKEGVLFAAKAGRCIIADEMGLGKTIQAIGATELMANDLGVGKVLIVCPTSLKYQWKSEIEKFTSRTVRVIEGSADKRHLDYLSEEFYKITSYNAIRSDIKAINQYAPDLVILDEAQRIKNWKTKTAQIVKTISSEYAIVLTGTPLENRLEELHSIVEFIDRFKLGALFRFLDKHQVLDEEKKVTGYKNLHSISDTLSSILIRRNKKEIITQLPERVDKNFFVPVTKEQLSIHADYQEMVSKIVYKWKRMGFLSEEDRNRLMIGLNCMRMVSDSTYILDQKTRFDTKIEELMTFLEEVFERKEEKVVIFSQWERMTRLIAKELDFLNIKYEYLHGGVPSIKRKDLLTNFHNNPETRVFLSTDAGGLGLNLQCASIVINLDIPWNPAVLEQRIARVHRLGQGRHVRVINFISTGTIEHRILFLLDFKKSLFEGVLDKGEDQVFMGEDRFKKFMSMVETITERPQEEKEMFIEDFIGDVKETQEESEDSDDIETTLEIVPVEDIINEKITENISQEVSENPDIETKEKKIREVEEKVHTDRLPEKQVQTQNIQELFVSGLDFLQKISKTFSDTNSTKNMVSSLIKKDEKTQKLSLNIPISDESIVEKAVNILDTFIQMLKQK